MGKVQRKEELLIGIPMAKKLPMFYSLNIKVYVFGEGGKGIHNYENSFCVSRIMGVLCRYIFYCYYFSIMILFYIRTHTFTHMLECDLAIFLMHFHVLISKPFGPDGRHLGGFSSPFPPPI